MMIKSGIGLAAAGIACVLFCIGAGWIAMRLIRSNRAAVITTLPVVSEQNVAVNSPGELVVSIEVPRMATEYRQWEIEVTVGSTRQLHLMKWGGPRSTGAVTGISTVKVPVGRLTLARPDTLSVLMKGLAPDANYSAYNLVLARPHLARMAVQIVGLVICGVGALLSLIWALWLLGIAKAS
jgi:hypothetical protein